MTDTNHTNEQLPVGVIGVGSMGRQHARVYDQLPGAQLVGVADVDTERAADLALDYRTTAMETAELLDAVEAVSIAVPTDKHYDVASAAVERDTAVLVEKPFVTDRSEGETLVERAERRGVVLQVGHVERFNPAVRALQELSDDLDLVGVAASRLGPPVNRGITVDAVFDLMIHDIDVLLALVDAPLESVSAAGATGDPYVVATLTFENGVVGRLTASRITQQKVRTLTVSARDCRVVVDYLDQSVLVHRESTPEYVESNEGLKHRRSKVVERPPVDQGEPLRDELSAFLECVRTGEAPRVTGEDGLRAIDIARSIVDEAAPAERSLAGVGQ
jgi:predicted dehydrogenase